MSFEHTCPYDGWTHVWEERWKDCGWRGSLCDRCKEDRADYRAHMIASAAFVVRHRPDPPMGNEFIGWIQRLAKPEAERDNP